MLIVMRIGDDLRTFIRRRYNRLVDSANVPPEVLGLSWTRRGTAKICIFADEMGNKTTVTHISIWVGYQ
jgi:hypothetical protein